MMWRFFLLFVVLCPMQASAQRNYAAHSVLSGGNWYKIAVKQEGVYKVDVNLLNSLGVSTSALSSATIRLYGNGGAMLDENNAPIPPDDLVENAIEMVDGGDGLFNGSDYFLFYAPGPHKWLKDSTNQTFHHQKNLYGDTAYYYITIGGTGKRIPLQSAAGSFNATVNTYNERYFYENDLVNFLNSGKEWLGEEFSTNLGSSLVRNFTVDWPGLVVSQPVTLVGNMASRSVGAGSSFSARINSQLVYNQGLSSVSGGFLDQFASGSTQSGTTTLSQSSMGISFTFLPGAQGAQGWLNWFEVFGRRALSVPANSQLTFRDWQSVRSGAVATFSIINNGTALSVWDVTNPLQVVKMDANSAAGQTNFSRDASRLREYIAFGSALLPVAIGKISNQDLHNSSVVDMIIITHASLLTEAQRLAQFHQQHDGYQSVIVTTDQVYQEFSSGSPDPAALKDFVKMYFDKAGTDPSKRPKYLLLFGIGSYDYRSRTTGNTNLVPVYESVNSFDPLLTYTSDDFFGLLEDTDDINANNPSGTIDIGIGRIPAKNIAEAKLMVDKIIHYHDKASLGAWRNQSTYIADDQDQNLHLNDAEIVSADAKLANPLINQNKIYLDAYPVVSSSAGARYPAVNDAIVNQVFNGTLILNYSGHGSYQRLAEEAVVSQEEINRFNNPDKLSLFITASCDFAPHDDPSKNSLGQGILIGNANGAIALLTTTRLVFAYSNRQINDNYLKIALKPQPGGQYLTLGESVRQAKNFTSLTTGDLLNNRKFALLGDPAMRLAFPELRLSITMLNGALPTGKDTLRALQKYTFSGMVTDAAGNPVNDFNGTLHPVVYDKVQQVKTLGNDPSSIVTAFDQQTNALYKGNATVKDGKFSFSFIVPKDISYQAGSARISLYADNGVKDANGVNTGFYIGGTGVVSADNIGPTIKPYLNDDRFQDGGLTNEDPVLLVKLYDSSGISTSGNGIGHDITAVIDGNERDVIVLNNFYTAYLDSYQQGEVLFQLPTLAEGKHTIRIKAWDVANNSSEVTLNFVVVKKIKLHIDNLRNYPNPFSVSTTIAFEHNQPNTDLDVNILVYNEAGKLVRRIHKLLNTAGTRNCQVIWNGTDEVGAKLAKGLYIYKVIVVTGGNTAEKTAQLILF